jgi:hypothetical protein
MDPCTSSAMSSDQSLVPNYLVFFDCVETSVRLHDLSSLTHFYALSSVMCGSVLKVSHKRVGGGFSPSSFKSDLRLYLFLEFHIKLFSCRPIFCVLLIPRGCRSRRFWHPHPARSRTNHSSQYATSAWGYIALARQQYTVCKIWYEFLTNDLMRLTISHH